ncbi:MAG TPA: carboxylating nicotinate-nucleotide diphosphorylase [Myxococcota bacterium]|nr:carboxylating nicotinate-nucleotide diphosphorylase [Myxococcota bacterium]
MLTNNPQVRRIVRFALDEDIGTGDITTMTVVPPDVVVDAHIEAKAQGVLAGLPVAQVVLEEVDPTITWEVLHPDGTVVEPGMQVMKIRGRAASLLTAERTLLNFVMRLSGVATATRRFVDAMAKGRVVLLDTRKTTPGLRVLEKYAVRIGGARNHRMGLDGGVLIKNNHIAIRGGDLRSAILEARAKAPALTGIEVEVRTIEEACQAIDAGADMLLLDHMTHEQVVAVRERARAANAQNIKLELSGNVTIDRAHEIAQMDVDFVSSGALTHQAPWLDFSMYIKVPASKNSASQEGHVQDH